MTVTKVTTTLVLLLVMTVSLLAADVAPKVTLDVSASRPREVEESTVTSVVRDYAAAWRQLASAVEQNRSDLLDASFAGIARQNLGNLIASQQQNGLRQRYVDHGHTVKAIFYSADGSALELHDLAQIEFQLLDGDKVVGSEMATVSYIAILTPAENKWKVRVLQSANQPTGN
jgi:hypothetical protein